MPAPLPILLLQGDAEARLLAGARPFLQGVLPHREVQWTAAWGTRPDLLDAAGPGRPPALVERGVLPEADPRALLQRPHRLVIFSMLSLVTEPVLRHRSGGAFLAHRGLREGWSADQAAEVTAACAVEPPASPADVARALEPVIDRLHQDGAVVAVCNAFRRVREPLEHRQAEGPPSLRELVRRTNLEVARLSQRTGCFVFDLDRPLAQEGGAPLEADCFGGGGRAAEIALDELLALVFDALPDDAMPTEVP